MDLKVPYSSITDKKQGFDAAKKVADNTKLFSILAAKTINYDQNYYPQPKLTP